METQQHSATHFRQLSLFLPCAPEASVLIPARARDEFVLLRRSQTEHTERQVQDRLFGTRFPDMPHLNRVCGPHGQPSRSPNLFLVQPSIADWQRLVCHMFFFNGTALRGREKQIRRLRIFAPMEQGYVLQKLLSCLGGSTHSLVVSTSFGHVYHLQTFKYRKS